MFRFVFVLGSAVLFAGGAYAEVYGGFHNLILQRGVGKVGIGTENPQGKLDVTTPIKSRERD